MNRRIQYLQTIILEKTPDIAAYLDLLHKEYDEKGGAEIYRKTHFLQCFAEKIPVVFICRLM